jgi:Shikimate kinase
VRVILIGYRGTGKTSVGRILAESLDLPFFDTDTLVERTAGVSIPEIFRQHGEARFRALERGVIESLAGVEGVISTGGGGGLRPRQTSPTCGGMGGSTSSPPRRRP